MNEQARPSPQGSERKGRAGDHGGGDTPSPSLHPLTTAGGSGASAQSETDGAPASYIQPSAQRPHKPALHTHKHLPVTAHRRAVAMGAGPRELGRREEAACQVSLHPVTEVTHPPLPGRAQVSPRSHTHLYRAECRCPYPPSPLLPRGRREKPCVCGSCRFKDIYRIINRKRSHCFWPGRPPDRHQE